MKCALLRLKSVTEFQHCRATKIFERLIELPVETRCNAIDVHSSDQSDDDTDSDEDAMYPLKHFCFCFSFKIIVSFIQSSKQSNLGTKINYLHIYYISQQI